MKSSRKIKFFHAPNTRSTGVLLLLEELGAPYELQLLNLKAGENRDASYLAVNPMGKVPAIACDGEVVTEQPAVYAYLADLFPEARLAPAFDDTLRGPYLRWLAFYGSSFEPAVIDKSQKREPAPRGMNPYGDYDTMLGTLANHLAKGPFLLGATFTAADVLWGTALAWTTKFGLVPELPPINAYMDRVNSRPALVRGRQKDAELAARVA